MRTINEIIIHCSDTRPDQDITAAIVDEWHRLKGWDCIGYHFFIRLDGTIEAGRPIAKIGAHCYGHNANSIGICYAGGMERRGEQKIYLDTRTTEQKRAMYYLLTILLHCYPSIKKISGHNQYENKACPCFKVQDEYGQLVKYAKEHKFY